VQKYSNGFLEFKKLTAFKNLNVPKNFDDNFEFLKTVNF
jgi:hypothetical protein